MIMRLSATDVGRAGQRHAGQRLHPESTVTGYLTANAVDRSALGGLKGTFLQWHKAKTLLYAKQTIDVPDASFCEDRARYWASWRLDSVPEALLRYSLMNACKRPHNERGCMLQSYSSCG